MASVVRKLVAVEARGAAAVGGADSRRREAAAELAELDAELGNSEDGGHVDRDKTDALSGIEETTETFQGRLEEETQLGERDAAGQAVRGVPDAADQSEQMPAAWALTAADLETACHEV